MTPALPGPVHVAGLLVSVSPDRLGEVERDLSTLPGLQIHARDQATGRLVVTLETASIDEQERQFARALGLSGVRAVSLVCHYVDA